MEINQIKKLYTSMIEYGFDSLELEIAENSKLKLVVDQISLPLEKQEPDEVLADKADEFATTQIEIRSDKVGTFSFAGKTIKPNDKIKKGEILGVVDGISFKDQIKCSVEGTIASVNITEGEIVDYGRLLFVVNI